MRGIDDLLIVLGFLIDEQPIVLPPGVQEAYTRLKTRQAEQQPFDLQLQVPLPAKGA